MSRPPRHENFGTLYFYTKKGDIQECVLGSKDGCSVQLEAGEFFYDLGSVFAPVKCRECESVQIAYFHKATCMTNDRPLSSYEDHMDFATEFECEKCGKKISLNLFAVWYNNVVNFFKHNVLNCSLVRVDDMGRFFSGLQRERLQAIVPPQ